jgi:hypothetical protein
MTGTAPRVTWDPTDHRSILAAQAAAARRPQRAQGWMVIVLVASSTALALFDLYKLAAGL